MRLVGVIVGSLLAGLVGCDDSGSEVFYEAGPDLGVEVAVDIGAGDPDAFPAIVAPYGEGCSSPCPNVAPKAGEACTPGSSMTPLECEYGGALDAKCNTLARCVSGKWTVTAPTRTCAPPVGCPSSPFGPERGRACLVEGTVCAYVDGACDCEVESAGTTKTVWRCSTFTCKGPRPRLGCSCTSALVCQYGSCSAGELVHGIDLACRDGVWSRPDACR